MGLGGGKNVKIYMVELKQATAGNGGALPPEAHHDSYFSRIYHGGCSRYDCICRKNKRVRDGHKRFYNRCKPFHGDYKRFRGRCELIGGEFKHIYGK